MTKSTRPSAISLSSLRMVSIEVMRSLDSTIVRAFGNRLPASFCHRPTTGPTANSHFLRRTMRAGMRARHREAAVMADQALAKAVIHQPGVADGAGKAMAAGAAQRQRRVAAAVEEQQRLFPPLDCVLDFL